MGGGGVLERGIFYKLKNVGGTRQEAFIIELEGVYYNVDHLRVGRNLVR